MRGWCLYFICLIFRVSIFSENETLASFSVKSSSFLIFAKYSLNTLAILMPPCILSPFSIRLIGCEVRRLSGKIGLIAFQNFLYKIMSTCMLVVVQFCSLTILTHLFL